MASDPEMACLMFEKFEVLVSTSPCFGAYRNSGQDGAFVVFKSRSPVSVPVSVCKEPCIFRRLGREIFPRNSLNVHSADLLIIQEVPEKEIHSLRV